MNEDTNRCVCCGEIIPEGRQVCRRCEQEACMHLWVFDGLVPNGRAGRMFRWRCQRCGKERLEKTHSRSWIWPGMAE